jgi:hypothetical protein
MVWCERHARVPEMQQTSPLGRGRLCGKARGRQPLQWHERGAILGRRSNQALKRTGGTAAVCHSVVQAQVRGGFAPAA